MSDFHLFLVQPVQPRTHYLSTMPPPHDDVDVSFIVTGFGPFGTHVPENPTTLLVQNLVEYCEKHQIKVRRAKGVHEDPPSTIQPPPPHDEPKVRDLASLITQTLVIETSAQAVRDQINLLYQQLCDANDDPKVAQLSQPGETITTTTAAIALQKIIILLHLGVNTKGTCVDIEECAYNDATFRIPDQQGFQPQRECILSKPQYKHGALFTTPFNVATCRQDLIHNYPPTSPTILSASDPSMLTATNGEVVVPAFLSASDPATMTTCDAVEPCYYYQVQVSTDPGRFVCNYLYCYSLATFCPDQHQQPRISTRHDSHETEDGQSNLAHATDTITKSSSNNDIPDLTSTASDRLNNFSLDDLSILRTYSSNSNTNSETDIRVETNDTAALPLKPQRERLLSKRVFPLLVHVPCFSIIPEEEQLEMITQLMKCLYQHVVAGVSERSG